MAFYEEDGVVGTEPVLANPVAAGTAAGFEEPFPDAGFYAKHVGESEVSRP